MLSCDEAILCVIGGLLFNVGSPNIRVFLKCLMDNELRQIGPLKLLCALNNPC